MRSILRSALALVVAVTVLSGGLPSGITALAQEAEPTPAPSSSPAEPTPTPTPPPPTPEPAPSTAEPATQQPATPRPATAEPATADPTPSPAEETGPSGSEPTQEPGATRTAGADGVVDQASPELCTELSKFGIKCMRAAAAPPDVVEILTELIASLTNCPPVCVSDVGETVQRVLNLIDISCDGSCVPAIDASEVYEAIDRLGNLVGDVCPGLDCVPDPGPYVDAITGIVADVCPGLDCVPSIDVDYYVERVSSLVTGVCRGSVTASSTASAGTSAAADPGGCIALVLGLADTVVRVVCGYDPAASCVNEYIDRVTTIVANVCSSSATRADPSGECLDLVMSVVALVLRAVCGSSNATYCANALIDRVATTLEGACEAQTRADPSGSCIEAVMSVVDLVLRTACQSSSATTCVNNLVARAGTIIENACRSGAVTSASTAADPGGACADRVDQVVDLVLLTACQSTNATTCVNNAVERVSTILENTCEGSVTRDLAAGTTAADPSGACLDLVMAVVNLVFQTICQSGANTTCVNNLITRVNNLVVGVCTGGITTATSTGTRAGVHPCVDRVTAIVNSVLVTVCQSSNATTCADNLITRVNNLLVGACTGSINTSATRAGELDHACVEKVSDLVDTVLLTVCQSSDGVTCANNLITRVNALVVGACTNPIGATRAGAHPCVDRLTDLVEFILLTACQSADGVTCANNLISRVNALIVGACTSPINTRAGEHPCVDKLTDVVEFILLTACQSADGVTCANNLITRVNNTIVGVCTGSISTRAAAHPCVDTVTDLVDVVLTIACQSTDALTCGNNLLTRVNNLLVGVCTGGIATDAIALGGTTTAAAPSHPCVDEVADVVGVVLTIVCQSDAAGPCASNVLNRVNDVLVDACTGSIATSTTGTKAAPPSHACVAKVAEVVETVLAAACQAGDVSTCADNLLDEVSALLADACSGGTVTTGATTMMATPSHGCLDVMGTLVATIVETVCASADAGVCAEDLVRQVRELLVAACGVSTGIGTDDAETCAQALVDQVLAAVPGVCVSSDALSTVVNCAGPVAGVIAGLLGQVGTPEGSLSVVSFQIYPRRIYPGSSTRPDTLYVQADVTGGLWRAEIRNSSGTPVRSFSGLSGATTVEWDGKDELGVVVPNGAYEVVLTGPNDNPETAGALESAWFFVGDGPKVAAVMPPQASIGERVTITGSGFTNGVGVFGVSLGDHDVDFITWTDNQIVIEVPPSMDPGTHELTIAAADAEATARLTVKKFIPVTDNKHLTPGVIYVETKPGALIGTIAAAFGDTVVGPMVPFPGPETQNYYEVVVPAGLENARIQAYAARSDVNFAEPVYMRETTATPNDTRYPDQWYLKTQPDDTDIDAPQAWNISKSNGTVSIGVLDTQIATGHPDLDALPTKVYTNACRDGMYASHHGTMVAGMAAAKTNNNRGVAGVGWNARPRAYQLGTEVWVGYPYNRYECWISGKWVRALNEAAGVEDIVNMSFGSVGGWSRAEQKVVNEAWAKGLIIVAAAGNESTSDKAFPAAYDHVVAVGALNKSNTRVGFSNWGGWVDVWAPGVQITSTSKNASGFNYDTGDGTSYASPLVAGVLALMIGNSPHLPSSTLVEALKSTTQGSPARVSADAALRKLKDPKLPAGTFVRKQGSSIVWFVDEGGKRRVTTRVLHSWGIPSTTASQIAVARSEQVNRFNVIKQKLGFRPGSLIRLEGGTDVYLVTNDGGWRYGNKRLLPPQFMACLQYNAERIIDVSQGELDIHPTGNPVDSCERHPDGTIIKTTDPINGTETFAVLQNGQRRPVRTRQLGASYGYLADAVPPALQDASLPQGDPIGFRPGRLIRYEGKTWIITLGGSDFARGTRREFANTIHLECFGLQNAPRPQAAQNEAGLHANGERLDC